MKKLISLIVLCVFLTNANAQLSGLITAAKNYNDSNIVTNASRQITAVKINTAFGRVITALKYADSLGVGDSIRMNGDTLQLRKGRAGIFRNQVRIVAGGGATDTQYLRRDINLNATNVATNTSNIALKLNKTDTAAMLTPYQNAINTNTTAINNRYDSLRRLPGSVQVQGKKNNVWYNAFIDSTGGGGGTPYADSTSKFRNIYAKSQFINTADFTASSFTPTINQNSIRLTGGSFDLTKYLLLDSVITQDENVEYEVIFKATTIAAGEGIAIGRKSINGWWTPSFYIRFDVSTGIITFLNVSGAVIGSKTTSVTTSANDIIRLRYSQFGQTVYGIVENLTTRSYDIYSVVGDLSTAQIISTPNTSKFAIFNYGGTMDVIRVSITSATPRSNIAIIGDSKTIGYSAVSIPLRYASQLSTLGGAAVFGGSGDRTVETVLSIPYILAVKPKYVILNIGRNDLASGVAAGTWQANYLSIVNQVKASGATIIHLLPIPEQASFSQAALKTYITSTFSGDLMIDPSVGWSNSVYLSSDSVHPSVNGHRFISDKIIQSGYIPVSSPINKSLYDYLPRPAAGGNVSGSFTAGRIPYTTGGSSLTDNANLAWSGSALLVTGRMELSKGNYNTAIGTISQNGVTGSYNTSYGLGSLGNITSGDNNNAQGVQSLYALTTGVENTSVGSYSLNTLTTGQRNTALGQKAGFSTTGSYNVYAGWGAGQNVPGGSSNTMIGYQAGFNNTNATGLNVFLGNAAGYNETGANRLYISNNSSANPLIYGEFDASLLRINGTLEVTGTVKLKGYTVATLPTGSIGMTAYVTDATAPTFMGTAVGGGGITSKVFHNGTTWITQ